MTYNNQFYISDRNNYNIYIYSSTGTYQGVFGGASYRIMFYNNKFYTLDNGNIKVYIFPIE